MSIRFQHTLAGAALLALPLLAFAQAPQKSDPVGPTPKEALHQELRSLGQQILELRASAAPARRIRALSDRYDAISRSLGGDDPAQLQPAGSAPGNPVPHPLVAPAACSGMSPTTTNFPGTGGPITPPAGYQGVTFTTTVSGAGTYLWDVNLTTFLTHTSSADLDITLQSPAGTIVTITTDNGGANDDVFNGTVWDDNVNVPCVDYVYTNLVTAPQLNPEGPMTAFRGQDPNGVWSLRIYDDTTTNLGSLASWSLDISTLASAPLETTSTFSSTPALAIPDVSTVSDTQTLSGLQTYLDKVVLYVEILHTYASDLDITLTSPGGTVVVVTTDNGAGNDNVFNGTTFDPAATDPVTDHVFANLVVATPLSPEGSFDNFLGQDPNGTWTLTVTDDLGGDVGTLVRWDLSVTTTTPPSPAGPFNTPGAGGAIPDFAGGVTVIPTVYTTTVAGAGASLWDVDLTTAISHTSAADLDITLTSPLGTTVTISTDNGGTLDDVFNGTLWDDNCNDTAVDHLYTNLVVATPLSPEGRLSAFRGENPNGVWTLTIADDAALDNGTLNSWGLDLATLPAAPPVNSTTISHTPGLAIATATPNTVADSIAVSGVGTTTLEVEVYLEVIHTYAADLDITLTSPGGTIVQLTTDNGAGNDNVFNGTLFDDSATDPVTDHVFTNLVVAPLLAPEGSLDNFVGQDPNGTWTLTVADDAAADGGTFVRWDLTIRTCPSGVATYTCTPGDPGINLCPCSNPPAGADRGCDNKTPTGGASISASGLNSLANPTLFFTTAGENPTVGSVLIQGTAFNPGINFGHGVRCAAGAVKRLYIKIAVAGSITAPVLPTDADIPTRSAALGDTIVAGQSRYYQVYYRDTTVLLPGCPAPANQFNVTNAAQVLWQP